MKPFASEDFSDSTDPRPDLDSPPTGDRWSTWDTARRAPHVPSWLVTELGAVDDDLGILKTGKEADVHVIRRHVPDSPGRTCVLACKRYRGADHRLFHRDAEYLEGRRVRRSREMRAMAARTRFGKEVISGMWAGAEFDCLVRLHELGLPVPAPVSIDGTEMLMEFVGSTDGTPMAAPRLAQSRPDAELLGELWQQLRRALLRLASEGWAHGDLSPYNVLLHDERLVLIDWPQVVDVIGNPHGLDILARDAQNMADWFTRRGLDVDGGALAGELVAEATARW